MPDLTPNAGETALDGPGGADAVALLRAHQTSPEGRWSMGWVLSMAAAAALLLLLAGGVAARVLLSLLLMAGPGIIGSLWRPRTEERFALVALWALGAVLAGAVTGGLGGPLAVWCLAPLAAALALGAGWREGTGLSLAAALVLGLIGALHLAGPPAGEPGRSWIALIAVLAMAAAFAGAVIVAARRTEETRLAAEEELETFQGLMGDLPDLALAMDVDGRPEAIFGQPFPGADAATLHRGLAAVATSIDRPRIDAALQEARAHGSASATVTSALGFEHRLSVSIRRTSEGGLLAVLRPAPQVVQAASVQPPAVQAPVEPPQPADHDARVAAAEAAQREAEIGREKAEADANARARFLANMSHELRTPLNAIMGFSDIMRAKMFGELAPKYAEYAGLIHESGGHLLDLINDVLDMSKLEANRYELSRETFDARDAFNASLRIIRLQADDAGVKLRAVLPPDPLMVDADKRALKQIALNLLSNAVKFTPRDGTVILTAKAVAGVLELVVADTGMGIAEADLKRIGQPYEQAGEAKDRARGTGLGLSLVDAFAKLHGGAMTLESRLGEGTAVTVRMPVLAENAAPPAPEPAAKAEAELAVEPAAPPAPAPPVPAPPVAVEPAPSDPAAPTVEAASEAPPLPENPPAEPASEASAPVETPTPPEPLAPVLAESPAEAAPPPESPVQPVAEAAELGPLYARRGEHEDFRRTVLDIFSRKPLRPGEGPIDPPRPPRDGGGVRVLE